MIQAVDDGVGRIEQTLSELNLRDNTVVIFFSDNGGIASATDMTPLRGSKGMYYEGGIRVPMFVRWPGVVAAGSLSDEPVIGVDLYPTLCEISGAEHDKSQPQDGQSLVPLLKQEKDTSFDSQRALFWHFPAYLQASKMEGRESRDPQFRTRPCSIIRQGKWKLHQYFEDNGLELYDLESDPGEQHNLAGQRRDVRDRLLKQLQQWQESIDAPIPDQPNPKFDSHASK